MGYIYNSRNFGGVLDGNDINVIIAIYNSRNFGGVLDCRSSALDTDNLQ